MNSGFSTYDLCAKVIGDGSLANLQCLKSYKRTKYQKTPGGIQFYSLGRPYSIIRMGFLVLLSNWITKEDQIKLFTKFYLECC